MFSAMPPLIKNTILPLLKENRRGFFVIFLLSTLVSLSGALQPFIMQHIIDDALLSANLDQLFILVAVSFFLTIFAMFISSVNELFYTSTSMNVLFAFREKIFARLFLHNKQFMTRYHSADLMSRVQGDVSELQRFFTDSLFALFSTIISLVFISVIIYAYNIKLMILIIVFLPIEFFCLRPLYPHMHDSTKNVRESTSDISKFFIESFRYIPVLKNLGAKEGTIAKLGTIQNDYKEVVIKNKKLNLLFTQLPAFISLLGKTLIISYGGYLTINGELKLGELIAFLTYFGMILAPVNTILGIINNLPKVKVSLNRVMEILPNEEQPKRFRAERFDIAVEGLSFAYGDNVIFEGLNLCIAEKSKIAIIGRNGIGKSTFGDLLCGLQSCTQGTVSIGMQEIGKENFTNLHHYIVKLEQTPVIFDDTLRGNLLLAKPDASDEELIASLEQTGMLAWFESLQEGLETNIYEAGDNLSGGQKQRIALSRIILLKPKIIILDEFTSAIDRKDTEWFFENITGLFPEATIVAITHHLDMLRHFDTVYELDEQTFKEVKHG
ncbi:ABC transporter ATP-binding protein [Sulfurimonas sp. HSL3-7]|uniref:ABC transporter ATP-binding protein n=1 Tax=Sulfonitrofixus jiaomeiensis TaxID=3131938 RepID=UPI0031F7B77B